MKSEFQDVYNCIAMFASYIRSGDQFDVIAEKAKQDAYAELKKAANKHERLVKALEMMVEDFGKLKCDMNVSGWGARVASLSIAKDLLSELEQEAKIDPAS